MCCDYVAALCRFLSLCALHPAQEAGADPDPDPNPNPNRCWLYIAFSLSAESIGQNSDADLDRSTSYTTPQKRPRSNDADVSPHSKATPLLRNCMDHLEKHQAKERRQGQGQPPRPQKRRKQTTIPDHVSLTTKDSELVTHIFQLLKCAEARNLLDQVTEDGVSASLEQFINTLPSVFCSEKDCFNQVEKVNARVEAHPCAIKNHRPGIDGFHLCESCFMKKQTDILAYTGPDALKLSAPTHFPAGILADAGYGLNSSLLAALIRLIIASTQCCAALRWANDKRFQLSSRPGLTPGSDGAEHAEREHERMLEVLRTVRELIAKVLTVDHHNSDKICYRICPITLTNVFLTRLQVPLNLPPLQMFKNYFLSVCLGLPTRPYEGDMGLDGEGKLPPGDSVAWYYMSTARSSKDPDAGKGSDVNRPDLMFSFDVSHEAEQM